MDFEIIGPLRDIEVIARSREIREHKRLGPGLRREAPAKAQGQGDNPLPSDRICQAEIHWYEAHGVGRRELKLKRIIDFA